MSAFRIAPAMPVSAYKTYELKAPIATHYRIATCQEVTDPCNAVVSGSVELGTAKYCGEAHCAQYTHGWITRCDISTDIGVRQAKYIVDKSGRAFHETTSIDSHVRAFKFAPGQR